MQKIEVFLPQATNIDSLEEILFATGVVSLSIAEMQVFDRKEMKTVRYRGVERTIRHNRKLKLEIITTRDTVDLVAGALRAYRKSGGTDNFPAFVTDLTGLPESLPR